MPKRSSERPQQRYATGEPGKIHGRDSMGIVEGSCGYRARGAVFGVNSSYRETWGTSRIATCLNVVLTARSGTSGESQEKIRDATVWGS